MVERARRIVAPATAPRSSPERARVSRRLAQLVPADKLFQVIVDSSEVGAQARPAYSSWRWRLGGIAPERALFLDDAASNAGAARRSHPKRAGAERPRRRAPCARCAARGAAMNATGPKTRARAPLPRASAGASRWSPPLHYVLRLWCP
jgi:hypothetical protein